MIKIYIQNKPLFLTDRINKEVEDYVQRSDTIYMDELSASSIDTIIKQMETPDIYAGVFLHSDLQELLEAFKSHLHVIVACGGLVYTGNKELLVIFRKGKWDLPKGKLDEGEKLEDCALREIKEETGAFGLQLEKLLYTSYHTYHEKGKHILKESHWFLIKASEKSELTPQTEEDIEKCEWVATNDLSKYTNNMHASIIDVIDAGVKMIEEAIPTQKNH